MFISIQILINVDILKYKHVWLKKYNVNSIIIDVTHDEWLLFSELVENVLINIGKC